MCVCVSSYLQTSDVKCSVHSFNLLLLCLMPYLCPLNIKVVLGAFHNTHQMGIPPSVDLIDPVAQKKTGLTTHMAVLEVTVFRNSS